jgi:hypothetical protein
MATSTVELPKAPESTSLFAGPVAPFRPSDTEAEGATHLPSSHLGAEPDFGAPVYRQRVEPVERRTQPVDEVDRRKVGQ